MLHDTEQPSQGFVELYDRLNRRLMSYLSRRVPDCDVAAELWAECWAVAFENWQSRRGVSSAESEAWVFGIARNMLAGYYRSGSVERRALDRLRRAGTERVSAPDEELERVIDRESLRSVFSRALSTLPPKRHRALRLRIVDELEYDEVAYALGCSEQAARAHVSRGLRGLAEALATDEPPTAELATL